METSMNIDQAVTALVNGRRVKHDKYGEIYLFEDAVHWKHGENIVLLSTGILGGWSIIESETIDLPVRDIDGTYGFPYGSVENPLVNALNFASFVGYVYDDGTCTSLPRYDNKVPVSVRMKS